MEGVSANGDGVDGDVPSDDPFDRPRRAVPVAPPSQRIKVSLVQHPDEPLPSLVFTITDDRIVATPFFLSFIVHLDNSQHTQSVGCHFRAPSATAL